MSSSSKSKSSSSNTTTTTDNRVAADGGAIVVSGGNAQFTDGGAFDFAERVLDEVISATTGLANVSRDIAFDSVGFVKQSNQDSTALLEQVADQQRSEFAQLSDQLIKFGVPLVALIILWRVTQ